MKKIVIFGGSGYIGSHLFARLGPEQAVATFYSTPFKGGRYFDPQTMGFTDLEINVEEFSHAVLLYGMTSPDACATKPEEAQRINVTSMQSLIDELCDLGITPVFASTEVVFDGTRENYSEADPVNPQLIYALQKIQIESHLNARCDHFIIVRLAKVYGTEPGDGTLLASWLDNLEQGCSPLRAADDFISSVLHIDDAVEFLLRLMERDERGLFHLGGPEPLSRYAICTILRDARQQMGRLPEVEILSCSINDFATVEGRPLNVSMQIDKVIRATGHTPRSIRESCQELLHNAGANNFYVEKSPSPAPSSLIRINSRNNVRLEPGGRTPAFFCLRHLVRIDSHVIQELMAFVRQNKTNARICLHSDPSALFHDMIIAEQSGLNYRPHRHEGKGETWHILEGRLGVAVFSEDGEIIDAAALTPEGNLVYRLGMGMLHTVVPLTPIAVYHESKPGPFLGDGDSIFPPWSPKEEDLQAREELMDRILAAIAITEKAEDS